MKPVRGTDHGQADNGDVDLRSIHYSADRLLARSRSFHSLAFALGLIDIELAEEVADGPGLARTVDSSSKLGPFHDPVTQLVEQRKKLAVDESLTGGRGRAESEVEHLHESDQVAEDVDLTIRNWLNASFVSGRSSIRTRPARVFKNRVAS